MSVVENTLTINEIYTLVGEDVTSRWEALGQTDSDVHWAYGMEAEALIPEFPNGLVYKAIAKKAGKSSQTIRKSYYTYKAFDKDIREKYKLCPYSIFQHARTQDDPEEVLKYYLDNRASVDEVEIQFPEGMEGEPIEEEFKRQGLDRALFFGIFREIFGIDAFSRARVIEYLREIQEVIKKANAR